MNIFLLTQPYINFLSYVAVFLFTLSIFLLVQLNNSIELEQLQPITIFIPTLTFTFVSGLIDIYINIDLKKATKLALKLLI